jgi:hypothetical protein
MGRGKEGTGRSKGGWGDIMLVEEEPEGGQTLAIQEMAQEQEGEEEEEGEEEGEVEMVRAPVPAAT